MEFWATEVKSGETIAVKPGQEMCLHLTQANLGEVKKGKGIESVQLFVNVDGKKLVLGTLISENLPNIQFDLAFDRGFELSHSWKGGSVYFFGYKIENGYLDEESDSYSEDYFSLAPRNTVKVEKPSDKKVITETANGLPKCADDDSSDSSGDSSDSSGDSSDSSDDSSDLSDDDSGSDDESSDVNEAQDDEDSDDGSEDDSDDGSGDDSDDDEDESDEEELAKAEPGKKRASDSEPETPASKKKVKLTTPEKTDGKKGSGVHVDTPYPSKKSGKTKAATPNQKTRKN